MTLSRTLQTLSTLTTKDLQARFAQTFGKTTPSRNRPWLLKRLAAAAPAEATPRPHRARCAPAADATPAGTATTAATPAIAIPPVGSEIRKTWRGRELVVTVQEDGFLLDGTTYRSLSAAATALCGGNRNGLVFFGLKPRPVSQPQAEQAREA